MRRDSLFVVVFVVFVILAICLEMTGCKAQDNKSERGRVGPLFSKEFKE